MTQTNKNRTFSPAFVCGLCRDRTCDPMIKHLLAPNFSGVSDYLISPNFMASRALLRVYRLPSSLSSLCTFRTTLLGFVRLGSGLAYGATNHHLAFPEFTRFAYPPHGGQDPFLSHLLYQLS